MGSFCTSQPQVQQQQSQTATTTPPPGIAAAGTQALTGAQAAASQPFQMPQAPVAGFSPLQQQYFNQIQNMQGMALPFMNEGADYMRQSATPVTGADVANYYNPMAGNVMANLQDIFGQQMKQTTGNLIGQAGGVGAERIGVGQSELAKQQGLSAGQTMSGLYQQALVAAQQQKQMQTGAGYGLGQLGPAEQAAMLQGTGALGTAGAQQQALAQAQMNAPYQQQLAQIAYPFQTAQYLAGITGGLAPAMGGTTTGSGTGTTTYPSPSPFAQIMGGITSGVGIAGTAYDMFGNNTSNTTPTGATYGAPSGSWGSMGGVSYPTFARGGFADGGSDDNSSYDDMIQKMEMINLAKDASGTYVPSPMGTIQGGSPMNVGSEPIPNVQMSSAGAGSQFPKLQAPQQAAPQQQSNSGSGIGSLVSAALPLALAFLERGGPVMGYADGGDAQDQPLPFPGASMPVVGSGNPIPMSGATMPGKGMAPVPFASLRPGAIPRQQLMNFQPKSLTVPRTPTGYEPSNYMELARALNKSQAQGSALGGSVNPMDAGRGFATDDDLPEGFWQPTESLAPDSSPMTEEESYYGRLQNPALRSSPISDVEGDVWGPRAEMSRPPAESFRPWLGNAIRGVASFKGDIAAANASLPQSGASGVDEEGFRGVADSARPLPPGYAYNPLDTHGGFSPAASPMAAAPVAARPSIGGSGGRGAGLSMDSYKMPTDQQPYPDSLNRDWGQRATRSPWMSLVKAGAAMMSTPGNVGTVIGTGLKAGAGELESQRSELRSEEQINQKAQTLYQQAREHLDKYNRMTMAEAAHIGMQRQHLDLEQKRFDREKFTPINYEFPDGRVVAGYSAAGPHGFNYFGEDHKPLTGGRLVSRSGDLGPSFSNLAGVERGVRSEMIGAPEEDIQAAISARTQAIIEHRNQLRASAGVSGNAQQELKTQTLGSQTNPIPYTDGMQRVKGKFYKVGNQVRQYVGP